MSNLSQFYDIDISLPEIAGVTLSSTTADLVFSEPVAAINWAEGFSISDANRTYAFSFTSYEQWNKVHFTLDNSFNFWSDRDYFISYDKSVGSVTDFRDPPIKNKLDDITDLEMTNNSGTAAPTLLFAGLDYNPSTFACTFGRLGTTTISNGRSTISYSRNPDSETAPWIEHAANSPVWHGARWDGSTPYADDGAGNLLDPLPLVQGLAQSANCITYSRDLSNANWAKTSTTATYNQVGLTGSANTASLLVATAGNATCISTYFSDAASRFRRASVWIKRVSGTGAIQGSIYTNGGSPTYADLNITTDLDVWQVAYFTATVTNPKVALRIVTNGNQIIIGNVYLNYNSTSSTYNWWALVDPPTFTTTATVTRNADSITLSTLSDTPGSLYFETEVATDATGLSTNSFGGGLGYYPTLTCIQSFDTYSYLYGNDIADPSNFSCSYCWATTTGRDIRADQGDWKHGTLSNDQNWANASVMGSVTDVTRMRKLRIWNAHNKQVTEEGWIVE